MEIVIGLILSGGALLIFWLSKIITFKKQPERYTTYEYVDPRTGEIIEAVRDNSDPSFNPEKDI